MMKSSATSIKPLDDFMVNLLRSQQQQHSSLPNGLKIVEDRAIKPLHYLTPTSQHYRDTFAENDDGDGDDDNQEQKEQQQQQPRRQPLALPSSLYSRESPVSQNKISRWDATGLSPAASTRNATLGLPSAPSRRSVDNATTGCKHKKCLRRGAIKLQIPTNFVSSFFPTRSSSRRIRQSFDKDHLLFDETTDEESSTSEPVRSLFDEETLSAIRAICESILELEISEEFTN
jgi:hypothetical protein